MQKLINWRVATFALLGLLLMGSSGGCDDTTQQDEDWSNAVLEAAQHAAPAYQAKNFTLRRTMFKFQQTLDSPELTGYALVTQEGVDQPLLYFQTFGGCFDDSTQVTNPEQYDYNGATLPLIEPGTGVYTGDNGSGATNCVTEGGAIVRSEENVIWSTAPIELNGQQPLYRLREEAATQRIDIEEIQRQIAAGEPTQ